MDYVRNKMAALTRLPPIENDGEIMLTNQTLNYRIAVKGIEQEDWPEDQTLIYL